MTKRRRLFVYRNVRIHLDEVEGLGSFVELESVLEDAGRESDDEAQALAAVVRALDLGAREAIAGGYADLTRGLKELAETSGASSRHASRGNASSTPVIGAFVTTRRQT